MLVFEGISVVIMVVGIFGVIFGGMVVAGFLVLMGVVKTLGVMVLLSFSVSMLV